MFSAYRSKKLAQANAIASDESRKEVRNISQLANDSLTFFKISRKKLVVYATRVKKTLVDLTLDYKRLVLLSLV